MSFTVPRCAAAAAAAVFLAALALLLFGFRNPHGGGPLPAPGCRRSADCTGRTACRTDGRCGFAGRLQFGLRLPSGGGDWSWVHLRLRDADRALPDRLATFPVENRRAFPEVDGLPEGRFLVELHASPRASADEPCNGDLRQVLDLQVENGIVRLGRGGRGSTFVNLAGHVSRPPCPPARFDPFIPSGVGGRADDGTARR